MKAALLLVDLQTHFANENPKAFAERIIPRATEALGIARAAGMRIIHLITKYKADKSDWPEAFKDRDFIWCLEDSRDSDVIEGFSPLPSEDLIVKKRFTGFYGTGLNGTLREASIDTLFICGYAADGCVRFTTMDAYNEGYTNYWLKECIDSAWEKYEVSLAYMKRIARVKDISNEEFRALLRTR
jgi:nicotinamidase-related amidase